MAALNTMTAAKMGLLDAQASANATAASAAQSAAGQSAIGGIIGQVGGGLASILGG